MRPLCRALLKHEQRPLSKCVRTAARLRQATTRRGMRESVRGRAEVRTVRLDFPEQYNKGRLNHASFGACPVSVRRAHLGAYTAWMRYPDACYFTEQHHEGLKAASRSCIPLLSTTACPVGPITDNYSTSPPMDEESVCLVENASSATAAIAQRWMFQTLDGVYNSSSSGPPAKLMVLNHVYKGCENILSRFCVRAGVELVKVNVPFPLRREEDLLTAVDAALREHKPTFAYIDHLTSQPAYVVPVQSVVSMCREAGVREIAIDAAQAVGSIPVDVQAIGADFWFSNLHKWAFAPPGACVFYGRAERMHDTHSPIPSWHYPQGFKNESLWTGTRDYSAMMAVPVAVAYLTAWRASAVEHSVLSKCTHGEALSSMSSVEFNHHGVLRASRMLSQAWGTEEVSTASLVANQRMVELPPDLELPDVPGTPFAPVRTALRDRFGVEAALGSFPGVGNFVRLSHAVYTTEEDICKLRDAVLQLCDEQRTQRT